MGRRTHNPPLPVVRPRARRAAGRAAAAASGFTLIEILVVVVILGILSAVLVPQIGSRDDLKTSSAARAMMADLTYAQNLAITRQQMTFVRFDTNAETYKVLTSVSPETVVQHPVLLAPFTVSLGTGAPSAQLRTVLIDAASFDGQPIVGFDEMGVPYAVSTTGAAAALNAAGTVVLKCGANQLTVTVEPFTGELNVN